MWNDKESDVDLLGHEKIAATVIEIINDNNLRPLTVGIYGDWGVGKSSILSLLQAKVKKEKELKVSNSHCILFNGWLFQGYEDAKSALMETVVAELAANQTVTENVRKLVKSLFRRINWLKLAKLTAGGILTGVTGLPVGGIVGAGIDKAKELLTGKNDDPLLNEEEETVTAHIHAFRKEFKELIDSSKIDHVIILVDDLDRCLPKSVIEVLEAIRLFLFVEGTTFVISADERMIEYAVREHFPNLPTGYAEYTKNYLEKLIQIPIRIPSLTRLQTGNYIKLLMLQNYLGNDYQKLTAIYDLYNTKKQKPYDPLELSYEIVTEALGKEPEDLKETLHIGSQITPTLSSGLKGNPRNIKRFLNTLFLRMRIARIYGLGQNVQLKFLAKLMLVERFQPDTFAKMVDEVATSDNGTSSTIIEAENVGDVGLVAGGQTTTEKSLKDWARLDPLFSNTDLRPYIFISKEKAVSFDSGGLVPAHLQGIYDELKSNSEISLNRAQKKLESVIEPDRAFLFEKLLLDSRSVSDFKSIPAPVKGLLRIIMVDSNFEDQLIGFLTSLPSAELGPWCVSELSGLKNNAAITNFQALLGQWSSQNENTIVKALATQSLKKK